MCTCVFVCTFSTKHLNRFWLILTYWKTLDILEAALSLGKSYYNIWLPLPFSSQTESQIRTELVLWDGGTRAQGQMLTMKETRT